MKSNEISSIKFLFMIGRESRTILPMRTNSYLWELLISSALNEFTEGHVTENGSNFFYYSFRCEHKSSFQ